VQEDVLDIFADVTRLRQRRRVGDREGDVEDTRERARQVGLADAGGADEEDVALLELDVVVALDTGGDPLVVVVDGDGEDLLGAILAHHVLVELVVKVLRGGDLRGGDPDALRLRLLLIDDLAAELHALVADVDLIRPRNQAADFFLTLIAERASIVHQLTSEMECSAGGRPSNSSVLPL
jgi:hypothetical protein